MKKPLFFLLCLISLVLSLETFGQDGEEKKENEIKLIDHWENRAIELGKDRKSLLLEMLGQLAREEKTRHTQEILLKQGPSLFGYQDTQDLQKLFINVFQLSTMEDLHKFYRFSATDGLGDLFVYKILQRVYTLFKADKKFLFHYRESLVFIEDKWKWNNEQYKESVGKLIKNGIDVVLGIGTSYHVRVRILNKQPIYRTDEKIAVVSQWELIEILNQYDSKTNDMRISEEVKKVSSPAVVILEKKEANELKSDFGTKEPIEKLTSFDEATRFFDEVSKTNNFQSVPKGIESSNWGKVQKIAELTFIPLPKTDKPVKLGSPADEKGRGDNENQHDFTLVDDVHMMTTEVTQLQWYSVMKTNPSHHKTKGDCAEWDYIEKEGGVTLCQSLPVESVTVSDIQEYVKRLKTLEDITTAFPGVEKAFALQAGRELRVIVDPGKLTDSEMTITAKKIGEEIEKKFPTFPGQIKVTMIREYRVVQTVH